MTLPVALLTAPRDLRFGQVQLAALERAAVVDAETLRRLETYRFGGDIWGYPEGETYLPGSPILTVEGSCGAPGGVSGGLRRDVQPRSRRRLGGPTIGTEAHAFTLVHDTEAAAFAAQVEALGAGTTLLVDTFDVTAGVAAAVTAGGRGLGAVRLDSGDLASQAHVVRAQLDALGATSTRIVVTGDLDRGRRPQVPGPAARRRPARGCSPAVSRPSRRCP